MVCVTGNRKTSFIQQVRIIAASVMTDFTRTFAYVVRLIQIMSTDFYCFEFHVKLYASHNALIWSIWKCKDLKAIFMLSGLFGKKRSVSENSEIWGNKINDFPKRELSFSVMVIWFYDFSAGLFSLSRKKLTEFGPWPTLVAHCLKLNQYGQHLINPHYRRFKNSVFENMQLSIRAGCFCLLIHN